MSDNVPAKTHASKLKKYGEVVHGRWEGNKGYITDAFINPDPDSPLGAILVSRGEALGGVNLTVKLISRKGRGTEASELYYEQGLQLAPLGYPVNGINSEELKKLGMEPDRARVLINTITGIELGLVDPIQFMREGVKVLKEAPIISKDPHIRDALLGAVADEFVSIRALSETPRKIGKE